MPLPAYLTALGLDFDPAILQAKYKDEREKRLRPDGNEQYIDISTQPAFLVDSYTAAVPRAPSTEEIEVAVLGGGFGGLLQAVRLQQSGVEDFKIIEKAGSFGGTWYWNRYPGAACDVESYIYLPLLEETNYIPVERYTHAPEILEHCTRIGTKFNLFPRALFHTEVTSLTFHEPTSRWHIGTNRGDLIKARFVVMSSGPLHKPKLAGIPGLEKFKGKQFHTSRWDYGITGGDSRGNLSKLKDQRVGIIGTGATAIQCVPHLGASAGTLYVFQRTPSSVDVRNNRPTDMSWARSLKPGWQKRRMDNFEQTVNGIQLEVDEVNDGWTSLFSRVFVDIMKEAKRYAEVYPEIKGLKHAELLQIADFKKMGQIRARVDQIVKDSKTAELLKPYYNQFCKRPCFHDEYLPTFNRPNVHLIDTNGKGVDAIDETGIIINGKHYEIDLLIHATGFEVGTEFTRRSGCEIYGRNGLAISEKWKDGMESMYGLVTRGFPNLFLIQQAQVGAAVNFPQVTDEQVHWIAHAISQAVKRGAKEIEVSQKAENEWTDHHVSVATLRQSFYDNCVPGYYNFEGKANKRSAKNLGYGLGTITYGKTLADWITEGKLRGLDLSGGEASAKL